MPAAPTPIEILLVEDNPGDIELTLEAFSDGRIRNCIHTVMDGEEALDFLYRRGKYLNAPLPDVVLLDINLPKKSGMDVLATIKQDSELRHIPVVMLTSSEAEADILKGHKLHANCYITKPVDLHQFINTVQSIESFWLHVVKLPDQLQVLEKEAV